jgi:hypothetical protein
MHVETSRTQHILKDGTVRIYQRHLLRRSFRKDGKVCKETLANLSALPPEAITALKHVLAGTTLVPAESALAIERSLPHGHLAAVWTQARQLGFPQILGPAGRQRDLAFALILSRVVRPKPKLSTLAWWDDVTLGTDLGVAGASTDEVYAAMDWLADHQDAIEATLARRHLTPGGMALCDLSSSWVEGSRCELAARGHSRDGKRHLAQIEYALLTDPEGRPVAIRVFAGNTADPAAFIEAVEVVREKFALTEMVMVGDRGMITSARIEALKADGGMGWITALRAPAIAKLAGADGPLQMSLFDAQNLAEITHPDYPGERLIACRNPALATERARKRGELLAATEAALAKIAAGVQAGRLKDSNKIGIKVGRVINKYKVAKHFRLDIGEAHLRYDRDQATIEAEAALDGIYVIRTSVGAEQMDAPGVVGAYKQLAAVERDFRSIKVDDLDLRPVHHRLADRVRAHVLICMLAAYLVWHLRRAWAPLTFTEEHLSVRADPVAPARRSPQADAKAHHQRDADGRRVRSFRDLLDHLATLTRNHTRIGEHCLDLLASPTGTQRRAFDLLGAAIPTTLS